MVESDKLSQSGLSHYLGGCSYNFRFQKNQAHFSDHVQVLVNQLDCSVNQVYTGQQVHGDTIEYCNGTNGEEFVVGRQFKSTDGLITDQDGIGLLIKFADCTPILLYDPVRKVQASLHSGWRSTVKQIGPLAIQRMVDDFHCRREDIHAYIGPSIDQANYEVGPEVYQAFGEIKGRDQFFKPGPTRDKFYLSMTQANYYLLLEAGLPAHQIEVSQQSTYQDPSLHSARREGLDYGLNGLLSVIRD
ncbi:polyphenol oxidase family protein [Hutsoniella sourekii]